MASGPIVPWAQSYSSVPPAGPRRSATWVPPHSPASDAGGGAVAQPAARSVSMGISRLTDDSTPDHRLRLHDAVERPLVDQAKLQPGLLERHAFFVGVL